MYVDFPPMRAGFCRPAKQWVATYDHFCPFLCTPIGERNHCAFWWYLFWQTTAVCWGIYINNTGFHDSKSWWSDNGHAIAVLVLMSLILLFVGSLCIFQTFLAAACMTTREFMRSDEVTYLRNTEDFDLPFSNGLCGNLSGFCCVRSGVLRALQMLRTGEPVAWKPTQWARPKYIVRDSEDWANNLWQNKYWSCC